MCSRTAFGCCKLALITANARGMASGRMVVGLRCWFVLDIEQVTSATWCACCEDDIVDALSGIHDAKVSFVVMEVVLEVEHADQHQH